MLICYIFRWIKKSVQYYILIRFKFDFTAKQIHEELCATWRHGYVSYSAVAEWLQSFRSRIDRPVTAITNENIDAVRIGSANEISPAQPRSQFF